MLKKTLKLIVLAWKSLRLFPSSCRFYPSCSEYAIMCLDKYPLWRAISKVIIRILRCNPLSAGGVDLP